MTPIRTSDIEGLKSEFKKLSPPKKITDIVQTLNKSTTPLDEVNVGPTNIGVIKKVIKSFVQDYAVKRAGWICLDPERQLKAEDIPELRKVLGLEYLGMEEFVNLLMTRCSETKIDLPRLSNHIDARIAEIEYVIQSKRTDEIRYLREIHPYSEMLQLATYAFAKDINLAAEKARLVNTKALAALGSHATAILSKTIHNNEDLVWSANFMIRVDNNNQAFSHLSGLDGWQDAERLWSSFSWGTNNNKFVVVSETAGSGHSGFWIPDIWPDGDNSLPGAPEAFHSGEAQSVFVDDPPKLPGAGEVQQKIWEQYMKKKFHLFMSFPIITPLGLHDRAVVGIVNVDVKSGGNWSRAYSKSWLRHTAKSIGPWLGIVWNAYQIECAVERAIVSNRTPLPMLPSQNAAPILSSLDSTPPDSTPSVYLESGDCVEERESTDE